MGRRHCAHCGEIVGMYERMRLLVPDGSDLDGSPLTLGEQLDAPGSTVLHERCYELFEHGHPEGRAEAS
jgi:hypothetical protein